jgi:hypothetical protein
MAFLLADRVTEIAGHLVDTAQHRADAIGIVLEIAQHLGKIGGPAL